MNKNENPLVKKMSIEEALTKIDLSWNDIFDKNSELETTYLSYSKLLTKSDVGSNVRRIINNDYAGNIRTKENGNSVLYNFRDIKSTSDAIDVISSHYSSKENFDNLMGIKNIRHCIPEYFKELIENDLVYLYSIPEFAKGKILLVNEEVINFKNSYISVEVAARKYNVPKVFFKERGFVKVIQYKRAYYAQFMETRTLNREMEFRGYGGKEKGALSAIEAGEVLGLSLTLANEAIIENNIERKNGVFLRKDIDNLVNKQEELLNELEEGYYTTQEVKDILNAKTVKNREGLVIPALAKRKDRKFSEGGYKHVYKKSSVDDDAFQLNLSRFIQSNNNSDYYEIFLETVDFMGLKFSENGKMTEKLFLQFFERKIRRSKTTDIGKRFHISVFFKIRNSLATLTETKEIYNYSENELNLYVFSKDEGEKIKYKTGFLSFLHFLSNSFSKEEGTTIWNFDKIIKPKGKEEHKISKEIYEVEEFLSLMNYVSKCEEHVNKSINDIKNYRTDNYINYASVWLYVLIHLNNGWRKQDVLETPRISLDRTSITNYKESWFLENNLTEEDINIIIAQLSSKNLYHKKTGKKRYFMCSEELKKPMAYALAICELRCLIHKPLSEKLIEYDYNSSIPLKKLSMRKFFDDFPVPKFEFKSLKMNRTVISYIYSIVRKQTNRDPLEINKVLRNHGSEEMSSIYIDIPQEHLDPISSQLFQLGHFGYVYTLMQDLIAGKENTNREDKDQASLELRKTFGDFTNIENIFEYISNIDNRNYERRVVKDYLRGYSKNELRDIVRNIDYGLNPGKSEGISCVFAECQFIERACENCQFAVPHFVSLSFLGNRVKEKMLNFNEKFEKCSTEGEKVFIVNNLYSDIELFKMAIAKFGEKTVNEFILRGDVQEIRNEAASIGSKQNYYTLKKEEGE